MGHCCYGLGVLSVVKASSFFFPGDQMKYLPKFIMPLLLFGKIDHALVWILCLCSVSTLLICNMLPWQQTTTL